MYALDGEKFEDYGIVAGRAPGSNLSLSGFMDLPKRSGKTFHDWGDTAGLEPFVAANTLYFEGRDLVFYGFAIGADQATVQQNLTTFYDFISRSSEPLTLSSPYGTYEVCVAKKIVGRYEATGVCSLQLTFREPKVVLHSDTDFSGTDFESPGIDGIAFAELGAVVQSVSGNFDRPAIQPQKQSSYGSEPFALGPCKVQKIRVQLLFFAATLEALQQNVNTFQSLLASAGLRKLNADGQLRDAWVITGSKASDLWQSTGRSHCKVRCEFLLA